MRCLLGSVLAVALLGGCGGGEAGGDPQPATGAPKEVAETIAAFERATASRDFERVCDELFTPDARERAGGDRCAAALERSTGALRDAQIELLSIRIDGERASVRVRTTAADQPSVDETIALVRQDGGYLISALGG